MLAHLNLNPPDVTVPKGETTTAATDNAHNDTSSHSTAKKKKKKKKKKKRKKTEEGAFSTSEKSIDGKTKESTSCVCQIMDEVSTKKSVNVPLSAISEGSMGSKSKTSTGRSSGWKDKVTKKKIKKSVDVSLSAASETERSMGSNKSKTSAGCTGERNDEVVKKKRKKSVDVSLSAVIEKHIKKSDKH